MWMSKGLWKRKLLMSMGEDNLIQASMYKRESSIPLQRRSICFMGTRLAV